MGEDSLLRCQVAGNNIFWERIFIHIMQYFLGENIYMMLNGRGSQTRENVRVVSCHLEKLQVEDDPNILQK